MLLVMQKVQRVLASTYRVITKQYVKRKQTYPECLHAAEKDEKVESVSTKNDYETTSKE